MRPPSARESKLPELMADLAFGALATDVSLAVVDEHGGADELRQDGGPARPDLPAAQILPIVLDSLQERVDERPLP